VIAWLHVLGHGLARRRQRHLLERLILRAYTSIHCWLHSNVNLVATKFCRIKQLWLMNEIVVEHCIHTLGRYFVVANLHVRGLVLVVHRLETAKVLHDRLSIRLFLCCILVIVSFQLGLSWFQDRVRLVTV